MDTARFNIVTTQNIPPYYIIFLQKEERTTIRYKRNIVIILWDIILYES